MRIGAAAVPSYDREQARTYWRFVPGGEGKIDTRDLLQRPDDDFLATWERNKVERRRQQWEERHFISHFVTLFADKTVYSFGCGLAYSETEFLDKGAHVTFADIVPSNVACARRLCSLRGYGRAAFMVMEDSSEHDFGGPYDYVFAYGSLMNMPEELQMKVLRRFERALKPAGQVLLMLYTPKFAESAKDAEEFARLADPSVGDLHNPWSDWHDDAKLSRLAPDFEIVWKQLYHEDRYVWYGLTRKTEAPHGPPKPFIDLVAAEEAGRRLAYQAPLAEYLGCDAHISAEPSGALRVLTGSNQYHYAVRLPTLDPSSLRLRGLTLALDLTIFTGGASIGFLDIEADRFVFSKPATWQGRHRYYADLPELPNATQIVLSNFQPLGPASSEFLIHSIRLLSSE